MLFRSFYVGGYHSWLASNFQDISPEDLSAAANTIHRVLEIMKNLDITAHKEKRKEIEENE